MTFIPIVERELRAASRRRGLYWGRFAAGLIAAVACASVVLAASDQPQNAGPAAFFGIAILAFLYAPIAGLQATCDCLSEEKREGTLGLLFLTDLKGYDVVFGKLAATSVSALYGLVAIIPTLAIPLLLGGVNLAEFGRVALVAMNLLLFFLAVGMAASSICRTDQSAVLLAIAVSIIMVAAGPASVWGRGFNGVWSATSPIYACWMAFDDNYGIGGKPLFWLTTIATQLYFWVLLAIACFVTPRSWRERDVAAKTWRQRWFSRGPSRRLLDANPFLWRSAARGLRQGWLWLMLGACVVAWVLFVRSSGNDYHDPGSDLFLLVMLNIVLKSAIAVESARAFSEERRSGALELLLSTPLDERQIIRGQRLALWRRFAPAIAAVLAAHIFLLWTVDAEIEDRQSVTAIYLILAGSLVADTFAISWWSMWLGLRGRQPVRAALISMAWILGLPIVVFALGALIWSTVAPPDDSAPTAAIGWACALVLATDSYFATTAQMRLPARFREVAAAPLSARRAPAS